MWGTSLYLLGNNPFCRFHMCLPRTLASPLLTSLPAQIPVTVATRPPDLSRTVRVQLGHPFLSEVWLCQQGEELALGDTSGNSYICYPKESWGILDSRAMALGHLPCDLHLGKHGPLKNFQRVWFHKDQPFHLQREWWQGSFCNCQV